VITNWGNSYARLRPLLNWSAGLAELSELLTKKENAEDKLIVEGYPVLDKGKGVVTVLAQNATTVSLQRAKKQPNPQNQG
jgi:hypothetical protein